MELSSQLLPQGCSQLELGAAGGGWERGWQHLLTQDWSLSLMVPGWRWLLPPPATGRARKVQLLCRF